MKALIENVKDLNTPRRKCARQERDATRRARTQLDNQLKLEKSAACIKLQLPLGKLMQSQFWHDFAKNYIEIVSPVIR